MPHAAAPWDNEHDGSGSSNGGVHPNWGPGMLHPRDTVNVSFKLIISCL